MMLRYLFDTDFCIYVMKNKPASLAPVFSQLSRQIAISSVTAMELIYGAEKSAQVTANMEKLESFLARLTVLDYDLAAARQTGIIRAQLAAKGMPIGAYDLQIAGHARSENLTLVTNNQREFVRVPGLVIDNWLERTPNTSVNEPSPAYS